MEGTEGFDVIAGRGGDDVIKGFGGDDSLSHRGARGELVIDLAGGRVMGSGTDIIEGIENAYGSSANDTLIGNRGPNELHGSLPAWQDGEDRDVLIGLAGPDILRGYGGGDWLRGGSGDDQLFGGPGNDACYGGWLARVSFPRCRLEEGNSLPVTNSEVLA